jgi:hypothetical protein
MLEDTDSEMLYQNGMDGVLATRIVQVRPYDPEGKGVVERTNQFLETSPAGTVLRFAGGFHAQLAEWLPKPIPGWSVELVPGPRNCSLRTRLRRLDCCRFRR